MRDGAFIFIHSSLATTVRLLSVRFWGATTDDDDEIISYNSLDDYITDFCGVGIFKGQFVVCNYFIWFHEMP